MSLVLETIVKQLEDSGIVSSGKLENFVPPKASPKDGEELLRELFKQRLLTKYQAQQVAAGRAKSLILGNYLILEKIGAGGMGQVFKAEHRRMKRTVALKMLPSSMLKDAAAVARFQREVEAAAKLRHTNIVAADDADEAGGVHFLVMEYVEGSDLSALVKKNGPFSVERALDCTLQAARGLEFAHKRGVIHRDIKPSNLLLDSEGAIKILDMGLATVDYMAPEQARSTHHADARADIYSLGCSLFYLLTDRPLYGGDTITSKLISHQFDPIPSFRETRDDVPDALEAIYQRMVAKKVEDRYQSMSEVIADLQPLAGGSSTMTGSGTLAAVDATTSNSNLTFLSELPTRHTQKKTEKQPKAVPTGTSNKRRQQIFIACAAGGLALVLLAAIVVVIRNRDGKEVARIEVPGDKTVEVQSAPTGPGTSDDIAGLSGTRAKITTHMQPEFQQWVKETQALPAEQQIEAVRKKLMELNPGFDGKLMPYATSAVSGSPKIENGVVTELGFISDHVVNLAPVRALPGLNRLYCAGGNPGKKTRLADLSPLTGMKLTGLICSDTEVANLAPLAGMPLKALHCLNTQVSDLAPLAGMPLSDVRCAHTEVSDLTPLKGMKLSYMYCYRTQVSDLTPLAGMPLTSLLCAKTSVSDLSPLKGVPLTIFACYDTPVSDLTPLAGMPLKNLQFTPKNITRGMDVIRAMASLEKIGTSVSTQVNYTPAEFWKRYDAGEFGKPTAGTKAVDLLLLGDGFVARFDRPTLDAVFPGRVVLNRGEGGMLSAELIEKVTAGMFRDVRPRIVVIQNGNNGGTQEECVPLADALRVEFPDAKLVFTSVLGGARRRNMNDALRALVDDRRIYFVDLDPIFWDPVTNTTRPEQVVGVNITVNGYRDWAEAMKPLIERLLNESPPATARDGAP